MATSIFGGGPDGGETTPSEPVKGSASAITEIAAHGDVVLRVEHKTASGKASHSFRISSPALKAKSKYFERLLQSGRFGEGTHIEERHKDLHARYGSLSEVTDKELPVVEIEHVGRISTIRSLEALFTDFLYILHGKDTQSFPPVANLANLAIVADRFDAIEAVQIYVKRKKMIKTLDTKTTPKQEMALSEEKMRQRLLVGLMLDYSSWAEKYSARLITKGYVGREVDTSEPLWWDLPGRVEEELAYRRECVLETIQSVQGLFLSQYSSRTRQCRLGYDSSPECDSFQFGEMVRFFLRVGTLRLQNTIFDSTESPMPYEGDIFLLLEKLKQTPEYQVDRNHSHCGIRTRIVPMMDLIAGALQNVGICGECWAEDRVAHVWMGSKRPLFWKKATQSRFVGDDNHARRHNSARTLFTAVDRDWS